MHQLPAFANMTMSVRRELCTVMVFKVVEQASTVILHDKQEVNIHFIASYIQQFLSYIQRQFIAFLQS